MKLLDNILLGEDYGKYSPNTLNVAIDLAKVFESKITPIYVLPDDIVNEKAKHLLEDTARSKLRETVKFISENGVETGEAILEFGSTSDAIVNAASAINASLVVLGAGDTTEKQKFKLGTTTERIIQKSEKPVFVVKDNSPLNIQQILCPIDFSSASKRALKNAILICRKLKAKLTILSVCEIGTSWLVSDEVMKIENANKHDKHKSKFDDFLKDVNLAGIDWVKEIPKGNPSEEILSTISRIKVDLLVMGTTGKTGLNRLILGSVTEKVIREVPCSFLTLKAKDAFKLQLDTNIKDLEHAYDMGVNLVADGFYEEAITQFKSCLNYNNMHVPAYFELAKAYDKINEPKMATAFRDKGRDIKEKLWYTKIEDEVRKLRGS